MGVRLPVKDFFFCSMSWVGVLDRLPSPETCSESECDLDPESETTVIACSSGADATVLELSKHAHARAGL